jgi:hypothetical protein
MAMKHSPELQEQLKRFTNPKHFFRMWVVFAVLEFSALALGIAFFLLVHGVIFGIIWFAFYWEPAYRIYTRVVNIESTRFIKLPLPWWRIILLCIKGLLVLLFFYIGVKVILDNGLLGQNLIYMFLVGTK